MAGRTPARTITGLYSQWNSPASNRSCHSQRYKVSRQTVRQALSVLEQEGLIEKRQGSGCYITGRSRGEDRIDLLLSSDSAYLYPMLLHDIKKHLRHRAFPRLYTSRKTPFPQNILFYRRFSTSRRAPCLWKV